MRRAGVIAAALLLVLSPAAAAEPDDPLAAGLIVLRDEDLRAATILHRLAIANAELCQRTAPLAGMVLHDASQYAPHYRATARRLFALGATPGVLAVVPGGAAERAGLRAGDAVLAIDDTPLPEADAEPRDATAERTMAAARLIDTGLAKGAARLRIGREGAERVVTLSGDVGCDHALQVIPAAKKDAGADGRMISITTAMIEFTRSDDELALLLAHELAHNALGHRARLDASGRRSSLVRATEIEADRLALYFMARAGYDIDVAPDFWMRLGRSWGNTIIAPPTHPGPRARADAARATIAEIETRRSVARPLRP